MMHIHRLTALVLATTLCSCASVPREAAVTLAKAGQATTTASQSSLRGLAGEIGGITERQLVRSAVVRCQAQMLRESTTPTPTVATACSPTLLSAEAENADRRSRELANVVLLRAQATQNLHAAYGAFLAEAEYDARADMVGALGELKTSVGALSAAATALTGVALPPVVLFSLAEQILGETEDAYQRRRLIWASETLQALDRRLVEILVLEEATYGDISATLATHREHVGDALLQAGLIDPIVSTSDFVMRHGFGSAGELDSSDPRVVAAARTIWSYQSRRSIPLNRAAYQANIRALNALIAQHDAFQNQRPLPIDSLTSAIQDMTAWAAIISGLDASNDSTGPQP